MIPMSVRLIWSAERYNVEPTVAIWQSRLDMQAVPLAGSTF